MGGVVILGAGLSGLGCALQLPAARIFEASDHPGGHAYSHEMGGSHFDQGAHICHSKDPAFLATIRAAAGEIVEIEPSIVRNYYHGEWLTYPVQNHLRELPAAARSRALSDLVAAHVRAAQRGEPAADYRAWCLSEYGEFLTDHFYRRFTAKYWRVGMEELATDWLAGRLLPSQLERIINGAFLPQEEQQAAFARFRYPRRGGFFGFFRRLYEGLDIRYDQRAVELDPWKRLVHFASGRSEPYEFLASSIPLPVLAAITKDLPAELRDLAQRLRHTQLICVNLIVNRPSLTKAHWFYVYDEDVDAARVSVPSNLAPGSAPPGTTAVQAEVFRRDDEPFDLAGVVERTTAELGILLGFDPARDLREIGHVHVPRAYVIADHGRAAAVEALAAWYEERSIIPMGLYGRWKYIWSDEAFRQGQQTAQRVRRRCA